MSIRDQDLPEFAQGLRGYDRVQVDEYVQHLRDYATELEDRAINADTNLANCRDELVELRHKLLEAGGAELPARLAHILDIAKEEGEEMRTKAQADADAIRRDATQDARHTIDEAEEARKVIGEEIRVLTMTRDAACKRLAALGTDIQHHVEHLQEWARSEAPPHPDSDEDVIDSETTVLDATVLEAAAYNQDQDDTESVAVPPRAKTQRSKIRT
jgi:cell division septum initiation protein DivIVA